MGSKKSGGGLEKISLPFKGRVRVGMGKLRAKVRGA